MFLISSFQATNANDDPEEEERLKHETMNGRLAKKIRQDMLAGKDFCDNLAIVLQGVLADLDSAIASEEAAKASNKAASGSAKSKDAESKKQHKEAKPNAKAESNVSTKLSGTTHPKVPENPSAETVAEGTTWIGWPVWTFSPTKPCALSLNVLQVYSFELSLQHITRHRQLQGFYSSEASETTKG